MEREKKKTEKEKKKTAGVEVLAPAGSLDGLRAAIGAGADAVYMGGARFGARAYADNPGQDALCEAIDYVHLHKKRIYLTVNTLLKPQEMGDVLYHYLKPYYEQGVDAVIVQDVGVLEFVAREFPGLPVHASTQMSLTMAEGAKCFEGYPVTRLVNARELGLSEIRRIRECSALEIESFVHGALCYCYSGQCLMSSMIGGRSGNRGRCAQPCRLEYDGAYLLSPKDICTLDMIPELIGAGINSFKIEGRMKRYEYAAGVTAAYRREVDRYFELGEEGYREFHKRHPEVLSQAFLDMQDLYNRGGFTPGYYRAHNGRAMMSMERPNHSGVAVARVEKVSGNRALLCATEKLYAQDVLEIRMGMRKDAVCGAGKQRGGKAGQTKGAAPDKKERTGGVYEFTLGQAHPPGERFEAKFTLGLCVKPGDLVYRTKNNQLLSRISEEYFEKMPKIAVAGEFTARAGEAVQLSVWVQQMHAGDGFPETENIGVHVQGEIAARAEKQPVREERLRAALEKTGDTPFYFSRLEIRRSGDIFIPVSALNALRREAMDALAKEIAGRYRRKLPGEGNAETKIWMRGEDRTKENDREMQRESGTKETDRKVQGEDGTKETDREVRGEGGTKEAPWKEQVEAQTGAVVPACHVSVMSQEQLDAALRVESVRRVYYDLAALPAADVPKAAARAQDAGKEFFLRLPRICRAKTYDMLRGQKGILLAAPVGGYLLQNYEELFLFAKEWRAQDAGKRLVADAMLYGMNAQAKQFFYRLGVTEFTAPYEENAQELGQLGIRDAALIVYGRLPLMTSAQCVYKNTMGCRMQKGEKETFPLAITDRKKKNLPVLAFCNFCYNVIYSPECLALFGCGEIAGLAPMALRYDFTTETGAQVRGVLENGVLPEGVERTYGHFSRGVL